MMNHMIKFYSKMDIIIPCLVMKLRLIGSVFLRKLRCEASFKNTKSIIREKSFSSYATNHEPPLFARQIYPFEFCLES